MFHYKKWLLRKLRTWLSNEFDYDIILIGSEIRMLKADIRCLKQNHDWEDWCATLCGNVKKMNEMKPNHYSYRACRHCEVEMFKSRIYHKNNKKEENAKEYLERI